MKYLIWINSEEKPKNIGSVAKNESSNIIIIINTGLLIEKKYNNRF